MLPKDAVSILQAVRYFGIHEGEELDEAQVEEWPLVRSRLVEPVDS